VAQVCNTTTTLPPSSPPHPSPRQRRGDLLAIPPKLWISAAFAGAIIIVCGGNSLSWLNRPFPGFFLWGNLFVPAMADTDWTGYQAQLPFLTRVESIAGTAVSSAAQVYERAASVPVGTELTYQLASTDGTRIDVRVPTMLLSLPEYLWTLGTFLGIGILLTLLGFAVYILRPDAAAAQAMLASGVVWGLYFATTADIVGPGWFRPLCLMLQALSPATLVHLALTFPVERPSLRRHPWILSVLYVAAVVAGIIGNLAFVHSFPALWQFNRGHAFACGIGGTLIIASLIHSLVAPTSAATLQRTKIAAMGGFAAFLLPVLGIALFAFFSVQFPLNFLAMPLALFPVAIGYAIVKNDLFEVDTIIRRSMSWAILTALLAIIYLGGVGTLEVLFTRNGGRTAQLLFLITIVAVFNPLRDRVQRGVDFLFARDRYDYRDTLAEASQALAALLDVDAIVGRILHSITESMHVDRSAIWLLNDDGSFGRRAAAGSGTQTTPGRLDPSSRLVHTLAQHLHAAVTEDSEAIADDLRAMAATLAVPMTFEHQLTGFLLLGRKESGQFYSSDDVGLLQTLAHQGAVALQNARSYEALRHANDELRAAQTKLIEAERLAAIGELSAAVAHGIRNPLAGIKAAAQFARMDLPAEHPLHESINDIVSESNKLEARIKTLLDFSKPFEPRRLPCRIDAIIRSAASSLRGQMAAQGVDIQVDIEADLPDLCLDAAQIEEVLLALLSNAAEAMPTGGHVYVGAHRYGADGTVRINVTDNGPGIPADRLDRVFKLFFTTKSSGTGFGLAVAKKVIERHGGSIHVESEPGKGAQFIIDLR